MAHREGKKKKPTAAKQSESGTRKASRNPKMAITNDQFRLMVDAVTDYAIYMLTPDGRIATWNPGAQRLKRYTESEVIGRHYSMFFPNDAIEAGKPDHELERARLDGRFEEEGWRVRKIGPPFWANVVLTPVYQDGELRGYVKITRDLTERKAAEDALRQSQQWLLTTLQSIGDAVIATDAAGDVKLINPVAQSLTGWTQDAAQGQPLDKVFVIVNEETRRPVTSPFYKAVSTGGIVGLANHTVLIARDGTEHAIADSAAPILDANKSIIGVVIVFRKGRAD
ncbi:PAS domain-containing protein [Nitrospira sp. Nam74]